MNQINEFTRVSTTVDGRNLAPDDKVNVPVFTRFSTSQVVQDFFHQQYRLPSGRGNITSIFDKIISTKYHEGPFESKIALHVKKHVFFSCSKKEYQIPNIALSDRSSAAQLSRF